MRIFITTLLVSVALLGSAYANPTCLSAASKGGDMLSCQLPSGSWQQQRKQVLRVAEATLFMCETVRCNELLTRGIDLFKERMAALALKEATKVSQKAACQPMTPCPLSATLCASVQWKK